MTLILAFLVTGLALFLYMKRGKNYSERDTSHPVFGKNNLDFVASEAEEAQNKLVQVNEKLMELYEKELKVKSNKEHSQKYIELQRESLYYDEKYRRNKELLDHMLEANISVVNGGKTIAAARKEFDRKEKKYASTLSYDIHEVVRKEMAYWLSN